MCWKLKMSAGAVLWKAISTTRSFIFWLNPAYYEQALRIYNKLKWEKSLNAYGLVDIGTLREREHIDPQGGSLAEKVETGNALAPNLHGLSARARDVLRHG